MSKRSKHSSPSSPRPVLSKAERRALGRARAAAAVHVLVPAWREGEGLSWSDVATLVGYDRLASYGLLDHRPDCARGVAGLRGEDVMAVGRALANNTPGELKRILGSYLPPLDRAEVAREFGCPQYVLGPSAQISHERYHELLDAYADTVAWKSTVVAARRARRDEKEVQTTMNAVTAELCVPYAQVRAALELAAWQVELAFSTGLFTPGLPHSAVLVEEYREAVADAPGFRARLAREEHVNAGQVAEILGVPRAHVDEMIAETALVPIGYGSFKWGTFAYFRRGDVDDLVPEMVLRVEARRLRQMAARITAQRSRRTR